jgi:predicted enzyme related to lactoylglutathione lyase
MPTSADPVVHLELHTGDLPTACEFYTRLFRWRTETICAGSRSYHALELADGRIDGGVVQCRTDRPVWLPYVEVGDVAWTTARARDMGAAVLLEPREGPAGRRSVICAPAAGQVGLWQPKA